MICRYVAIRFIWTCSSIGPKRRWMKCQRLSWTTFANAVCVFENGSLSKPPRLWPRSLRNLPIPIRLAPSCAVEFPEQRPQSCHPVSRSQRHSVNIFERCASERSSRDALVFPNERVAIAAQTCHNFCTALLSTCLFLPTLPSPQFAFLQRGDKYAFHLRSSPLCM